MLDIDIIEKKHEEELNALEKELKGVIIKKDEELDKMKREIEQMKAALDKAGVFPV